MCSLWKEITIYLYIQKKTLTTRTINIRFTTVKYYSLITYNLFNIACVIYSHLNVRNAWHIGYLLHAFQNFKVFLLIEYATLSFEAYFSLVVYILTRQILWFTFLSFTYLIP
jgi:hypothetical protein